MRGSRKWWLVWSLIGLSACGESGGEELEARAVPSSQSAAARALRLPRMRAAQSREPTPSDVPVTLRVLVRIVGAIPADSTVQVRSFNPLCGESFVDSAVVRTGDAVTDAVVWIEGATPVLATDRIGQRRPIVVLESCRLLPRVQVATPGSTLHLVLRDSLTEMVVAVPPSIAHAVDSITFTMPGQLVPLPRLADSAGVIGVYGAGLPWARAFVAIAPPGVSAVSDAAGRAQFTLDGRGTQTTVRAWHPSLGVVAAKVSLSAQQRAYDVTLTYQR
jgi:hypothetical protein